MTQSAHYPFIQSILEDPDEDASRLVYADWLDDRDTSRAEAIRLDVQVQNALRRRFFGLSGEEEAAKDRCEAVDKKNTRRWHKELPKVPGIKWGDCRGEFTGGLCEAIYIDDAEAFLKHASQILDAQPVTGFIYRWQPSDDILRQILGAPAMARLGALSMGGHYQGPGPARVLIECRHLKGLKSLALGYSKLTDEGPLALAQARHLNALRHLDVSSNQVSAVGVQALVQAVQFKNLEGLNLASNEFGPEGAEVLASGKQLKRLRRLYLGSTRIGGEGLRMIVRGLRLEGLKLLSLPDCELDPESVRTLGQSGLKKLEVLDLTNNKVGTAGAEGLAGANLGSLKQIVLDGCGLDDESAQALARAKWLKHVEKLFLSENPFGDAGLTALAKANLSGLTALIISVGRLGHEGVSALVRAHLPNLRSLRFTRGFLAGSDAGDGVIRDETARLLCDPNRMPSLQFLNLANAIVEKKTKAMLRKRFGKGLTIFDPPKANVEGASNPTARDPEREERRRKMRLLLSELPADSPFRGL